MHTFALLFQIFFFNYIYFSYWVIEIPVGSDENMRDRSCVRNLGCFVFAFSSMAQVIFRDDEETPRRVDGTCKYERMVEDDQALP